MNPVPELEMLLLTPLVGESMLELGNKRNKNGTFKDWFSGLGFHHVSVDLNGKDGSLQLDLQEPLHLGRFDMVTNFGTTEHVEHQEPAWRNIVEATEKILVSTTPLPGSWKRHGKWYPKGEFYTELARLNGFVVERLYVDSRKRGQELIFARLRRVAECDFEMPSMALIFDNGDHGLGMAP